MEIYSKQQVIGDQIGLGTSQKMHINGKDNPVKSDDPVKPFAEVLFNAVDQVNQLQIESNNLEEQWIVAPDEVDIHQVMIASEKARLSVSFMKTIVEKAMKAYNDIMMIR
ncbi:MAG: flagellar hook-basal body complex protein FliE [Brevinematales bacterium]|nr:flagellar hook-basal body complex protein FliE [Brevinematales bacterium]